MTTPTDCKRIEEEARLWISNKNKDLQILTVDENESRIDFLMRVDRTATTNIDMEDLSFFVTFNNEGPRTSWHLWSEKDNILPYLQLAIEKCTSCNNITDILDLIYLCYKQNLDKSCELDETGYEYEDNEDIEDYYDNDDYYCENDNDKIEPSSTKSDYSNSTTSHFGNNDEESENFFKCEGNPTAVARLLKDLKNMQKVKGKYGIEGSPRGDNLFLWDVKLTDIPLDTLLGQDLNKYSIKYKQEPVIQMEMQFPQDYPFSPPFIRVIRPRFQFMTGHITIGGSICMQMLTKSGWSPSNDIELILIQVRSEILSDSKARLSKDKEDKIYSLSEAKKAFMRMVQKYGWS